MTVSRRALFLRAALGGAFGALFSRPAHATEYTYDATGRLVRVEYDDGSTVDYA